MLAAVYMRVFLKENIPDNDGLTQRMIKGEMADDVNQNESNNISLKKTAVGKKIPSLGDLIFMLKSR